MELNEHDCIGRTVCLFENTPLYPRCGEGAFLRLKDGAILFVYSRFRNSPDDDAPSDLVSIRSTDEGETWSEPEETVCAQEVFGVRNVMSASLMRMLNGDVGLFYIVKRGPKYTGIVLSRSADEGKTFYKHTECTLQGRPGYYVLNNDRMIRLGSGRLVMPLAWHAGGRSDECRVNDRASVCFLLSDDDGESWREARDVVYPPFRGTESGLQEPGVTQLKNGVLWAFARTDQFRYYETFSMNGGETWTKPQPSRFSGPNSPISIRRVDGAYWAIWNPAPVYNGRITGVFAFYGGRTPLVISSSADGLSWPETYSVIANDPKCNYCYPALFKTAHGSLLVAYMAVHKGHRLFIKKIGAEELNKK